MFYGVVIMVNYWANAGKYLGDIHDFFKNNNAVFLDPDNGILKKRVLVKPQ